MSDAPWLGFAVMRRLNAAGAGAIGFIYYSGHGAAEKDTNINYLIPVAAHGQQRSSLSSTLAAMNCSSQARTPARVARGETIRMLTSMVGAVVLARAVDDADLSREILEEAARQ